MSVADVGGTLRAVADVGGTLRAPPRATPRRLHPPTRLAAVNARDVPTATAFSTRRPPGSGKVYLDGDDRAILERDESDGRPSIESIGAVESPQRVTLC